MIGCSLLVALIAAKTVCATPLESWRSTWFSTSENAGDAADSADPDGDGSSNLEEYAFGTNPLDASSRFTPASAFQNGRVQVSFPRDAAKTDLTYYIQASSNLKTWSTIATSAAGAATVNQGAGSLGESGSSPISVAVGDATALGAGVKRFLRMGVTPAIEVTGGGFSRLFANQAAGWNVGSWQPTLSAPPTISQSNVDFLPSGTEFKLWQDKTLVNFETADMRVKGSGYPNAFILTPGGITAPYGGLCYAYEFVTNAGDLELVMARGGASNRVRVWVDGQIVDPFQTVLTASAAWPWYFRLQFTGSASRRIRIEQQWNELTSIKVAAGSTLVPAYTAATRPIRATIIGDSYSGATGAASGWTGFALTLREKFHWDVWVAASGGTGYLKPNPASGEPKFRDRINTDVIPYNPDVVIIAGGTNDGTYAISDIQTEAGLLYDALRAALPNALLIAVGPFHPTTPVSQDKLNVRTAVMAACASRNVPFIDPLAPGKEWMTATNKTTYYGGTAATASASVSSGSVSAITVTNGGNGYAPGQTPSVAISGGGGSGASAVAQMSYTVTALNVLNGGRGYATPPVVSLSGGGGSGATATATVSQGVVTALTVTNAGTGYTSAPTVTISGGGGCGCQASAAVSGGVSAIAVTNAGTGYTSAPTVTLSNWNDNVHPNQNGHYYIAERIAAEMQKLRPVERVAGGAIGRTLLRNSDSIVSASFTQPPSASARLASAVAAGGGLWSLSAAGSPAWGANQFVGLYYVRFTSGAKNGCYYTITANASGQLTVDSAGDDLSGLAAGDTFLVVKYWTLSTLFPPALAGTPANPLTVSASTSPLARRSQILVTDPNALGINLSAAATYYFTPAGWFVAGSNQPANNAILYPDLPFTIRQPVGVAADVQWTQSGAVNGKRIATSLQTLASGAQDNPTGMARPLDLALSQLGLETAFVSSASTSPLDRRDQLFVFDNAVAGLNKSAARVYYRTGGSWRKVGADAVSADADTIPAGDGFTIRKYQSGNGASIWWNNDPAY